MTHDEWQEFARAQGFALMTLQRLRSAQRWAFFWGVLTGAVVMYLAEQ